MGKSQKQLNGLVLTVSLKKKKAENSMMTSDFKRRTKQNSWKINRKANLDPEAVLCAWDSPGWPLPWGGPHQRHLGLIAKEWEIFPFTEDRSRGEEVEF